LLLQAPLLFLLQCREPSLFQEPSLSLLSFDPNRRFSDCACRRRTFRANGLRASSASGTGTYTANWQSKYFGPTSASCATLIDLQGPGSGNVTLRYYGL
jgi:hypothetical protein